MTINKFMKATLRWLSYPDWNIKKNYELERKFIRITHPAIPSFYRSWDHKIERDGYEIPVRIFEPPEIFSPEILLFFHGGGWVTGTIDTYTGVCSAMAEHTGRKVISVDYRLAPEHKFPVGLEDCYHAAKELFLNTSLLNAEAKDIILIGDSAGGNLAAAVSLMAADRGEFMPRKQILIYPAVASDHSENSPYKSIRKNGTGYLLTAKKIQDYLELYVRNKEDLNNPYFAPLLRENLSGQPKTLMITAQYDPLRDEGEAYGAKLKHCGVETRVCRLRNGIHGFFSLPIVFPPVKKCYQVINRFLGE